MALHDITQIGYTESGVDTLVSAEASLKDIGDNALVSKINDQLIDKDAQNVELTERNNLSINIMNAEIDGIKASRYASLGPVAVEPTPPNEDLTTKINVVAKFYSDTKGVFEGLESTSSLNAKATSVSTQEILNDSRLDEMEATIDPNSFKEVYDKIMGIDITDPDTPAGFEANMRREIKKLADNGSQERGKCLVYKDENSKTYYELYIKGGLITLEEVYNPLKDIIQSYLLTQKSDGASFTDPMFSKIHILDHQCFIVYSYAFIESQLKHSCKLFLYNDSGVKLLKSITHISNCVAEESFNTNSAKILKVDNSILFYHQAANDTKTLSSIYPMVVNYDPVGLDISIVTSGFPLTTLGSTASQSLGKFGSCVNNNYIFMSDNINSIKIYSRSSGILFNSINMNSNFIIRDGTLFNAPTGSLLVCDEQYVYSLTVGVQIGSTVIKKYNINDQSLAGSLYVTDKSLYGKLWMINGKLAVIDQLTKMINFIDPTTLTFIPDGDHDFVPILLTLSDYDYVDLIDLGNSKMMLVDKTVKIVSYDGYDLYSMANHYNSHTALNEETLISLTSGLGGFNMQYKSKPIYK